MSYNNFDDDTFNFTSDEILQLEEIPDDASFLPPVDTINDIQHKFNKEQQEKQELITLIEPYHDENSNQDFISDIKQITDFLEDDSRQQQHIKCLTALATRCFQLYKYLNTLTPYSNEYNIVTQYLVDIQTIYNTFILL